MKHFHVEMRACARCVARVTVMHGYDVISKHVFDHEDAVSSVRRGRDPRLSLRINYNNVVYCTFTALPSEDVLRSMSREFMVERQRAIEHNRIVRLIEREQLAYEDAGTDAASCEAARAMYDAMRGLSEFAAGRSMTTLVANEHDVAKNMYTAICASACEADLAALAGAGRCAYDVLNRLFDTQLDLALAKYDPVPIMRTACIKRLLCTMFGIHRKYAS